MKSSAIIEEYQTYLDDKATDILDTRHISDDEWTEDYQTPPFNEKILIEGTEKYSNLCLKEEALERLAKDDFRDDHLKVFTGRGREIEDWEFLSERICDDKKCKSTHCRCERIDNYLDYAESIRENKMEYERLFNGYWENSFIVKFRKKGNRKLIEYLKFIGCEIATLLKETDDEKPYYYCSTRFCDINGFNIKPYKSK